MSGSDSEQSSELGGRRYLPGLDGLRALSVLAVIAYHLNLPWASGGFLGVGIFFTLSGYLITDQLMLQWQNTKRINLKEFWLRRIRRLIPAVLFMLAIVYLWLILFQRSRLDTLRGDFISVILYLNNWWLIFHNVSYFESFGPPSPIAHLWSLAIEEQFYLLWPVLLAVLLRGVSGRRKLVLFTLLGAAASMLAMVLLYEPGTDPSRVYYGTDTRVFALLIGAAFAIACPSWKFPQQISPRFRWALDLLGGAGLLGIILALWKTNEYAAGLYDGGLALFAVLSAIVTVILAHPAGRVAGFMSCKPLRWIGVRSYSLYLWHYPVIILTTPTVDTGGFNGSRLVLQLAASFLLAALSWRFVEEPIRRGSLEQLWRNRGSGRRTSVPGTLHRSRLRHLLQRPLRPRLRSLLQRSLLRPRLPIVLVIAPLCFFSTSCSSYLGQENTSPAKPQAAAQQVKMHNPIEQPAKNNTAAGAPAPKNTTATGPSTPKNTTAASAAASKAKSGEGITAIGDSVILDAAPYLGKLLPGIAIDGKLGRQMAEAQELVDRLKGKGKLGSRVIIELGTNGPFTTSQLRQLLKSLGSVQQIVLVNTRVPKRWQNTVNSDLKTVAAEFTNVTLVDWFSASRGKNSFFYNDGVHLRKEGAKYYALLVSQAIGKEQR